MLTIIAAMMLAPTAAEPATNKDDPVICTRRGSHTVGTRLSKKVCMKKSDWEYIEKQTQSEMQSLRDRHLSPGGADGNRGGPQ